MLRMGDFSKIAQASGLDMKMCLQPNNRGLGASRSPTFRLS